MIDMTNRKLPPLSLLKWGFVMIIVVAMTIISYLFCQIPGAKFFMIRNMWISFIAIFVGIGISRLVQKLDSPKRYRMKEDWEDGPFLGTLNGCGARLIGVSGNELVKYQFFCIMYMPILPTGCYAARSVEDGYQWYGYAKWRLSEILGIYFKWWGCLFFVFSFGACMYEVC